MQIEDRGLVYDASTQRPERRIAFFTSLATMRSGTILAGFQVGPRKQAATSTLGFCRSSDGARTWQEVDCRLETTLGGVPGSLAGGEIVETAPGKLFLFSTWFDRSDPNKPLFDPITEGVLPSRQLCASSSDEGKTWTPWREVPVGALKGTAMTGPAVRWTDGTIGFAFESYKEYSDPTPARHGAWILLTKDGGQTFSEPYLVAQHPEHRVYYWDQRLCAGRGPGDYIALFWTHDLQAKCDLNVHLRRANVYDGDFERMPIRVTPIRGQIAAPLLMDDGRLLAFVVDRHDPPTMRLWLSPDGGETWPESESLLIYDHREQARLSQGHENIDFKQYWEDMGKWTFGHPAIQHLPDGRVLVAWYAGTPERLSIHWARVRA